MHQPGGERAKRGQPLALTDQHLEVARSEGKPLEQVHRYREPVADYRREVVGGQDEEPAVADCPHRGEVGARHRRVVAQVRLGGTHVDAALVGADGFYVVLLDPAGDGECTGQQDVEGLGRVAFDKDRATGRELLDVTPIGQPAELIVGQRLEQEERLQLGGGDLTGHWVSRNVCTRVTAIAPSPTAEATRLTELARTSPAAKMPGTLDSR